MMFAAFGGLAFRKEMDVTLKPGESTTAVDPWGHRWKFTSNGISQFESLNKDFDALRKKFGVPLNAAPAGGRGGGRGGAVDPENVLGRTAALKSSLMGIWEAPSGSLVRQYNELKLTMPKAVADANALLARATSVSQALKKYDITMTVPPAVK